MAEIFNKESLDRLSEPDALDKYIRVANPGAWLAVVAVALVLIALFAWASLGSVDGVTVLEALFG